MTFKTDVDTIITTITGNEDNTTLLTSLSTYMYDDKLDDIINNEQFPDISRFDPVAQVIGIRPGQVCEILRPSKTAITAPYYRICN